MYKMYFAMANLHFIKLSEFCHEIKIALLNSFMKGLQFTNYYITNKYLYAIILLKKLDSNKNNHKIFLKFFDIILFSSKLSISNAISFEDK